MPSAPPVVVGHCDAFRDHPNDPTHPEQPARSDAVRSAIEQMGDRIGRYDFGPATRAQLERVHHPRYIDEIEATRDTTAPVVFDDDTVAYAHTYDTAVLASGAAIGAVDAVLQGGARRAFSLARPPGHHAEVDRAMGFCFFNHVAVAAQQAIDAHGCSRVAIVDWDVHHGNGTQRAFERRRDVLFISSHQYKLFPGSGHHAEMGSGPGKGFSINLPLPYDAGDDDLLRLHASLTVPVLEAFAPELILISAGFDAHVLDPSADQRVTADGFGALAAMLFDVADRVCDGRVALVLEGGYDLGGLSACVTSVLEAAIEPAPRLRRLAAAGGMQGAVIERLIAQHSARWPSLLAR